MQLVLELHNESFEGLPDILGRIPPLTRQLSALRVIHWWVKD